MDASFLELIEVEQGNLMLRDADHCGYGRATLGVTATDSKSDVWVKLRPRMRRMLLRLIDAVPTLFDEMVTAFPDAAEIEIPRAYITYNRSSDIFPSEGPPVYWRHSALGVGLVKLASKIAPLPSEVDAWRRSLVCYDTLELRFLNVSTRCWAEPDSVVERRRAHARRRTAAAAIQHVEPRVVLNLIAAVVSLTFLRRVWRLWCVDRFSDLTLTLAFNLDVQGLGMIRSRAS
ncbi:hypothetical protein PINS_up023921 [Pythium insidiosum]|nr:hypothetical protein PINS_up023921 [Pythium insidiosum]